MNRCNMAVLCLLPAVILLAVFTVAAGEEPPDAGEKPRTDVSVDRDEAGNVVVLKIDTDKDGVMDRFQYYASDQVIRVESDADQDGRMECIDYLEAEKRIRQVRFHPDGSLLQESLFGDDGLPHTVRRDTNGDGTFDLFNELKRGTVVSEAHDPDQDGRMNRLSLYENNLPIECRRDHDGDGRYDDIVRFKEGLPCNQERDTNGDGRFDYHAVFDEKGQVTEIRETDASTGLVKRIREFEEGMLAKTVEDTDLNGLFETRSFFTDNRMVRQEIDSENGKYPLQIIDFDANGNKRLAKIDTDHDGRLDTFQHYDADRLALLEKDQDGNGRVDLRIEFENGKRKKLSQDSDGNGYFEIVQTSDPSTETVVTCRDMNEDGSPDERLTAVRGVLREKWIDANGDSLADRVEYYDDEGELVRTEEDENNTGYLSLVWYFDDKGNPVRAERDTDGDERPDTWFEYADGRIRKVSEDTNHDGQPDLWETYDRAEVLVSRSKDLDFDGSADLMEGESSVLQ